MTERTIEVERTVTEEEKLLICDYCGSSEEDGDGEMWTYKNEDRFPSEKLHIHEECVKGGLGDIGPRPSPREVSRWDIVLALDSIDCSIGFIGMLFIFAAFSALGTGDIVLTVACSIVGLLVTGGVIMNGKGQAEEVREEWKDWF